MSSPNPGGPDRMPALPQKMHWYDGFALTLAMPAALIASLGASIGGLGAWGALALWAVSMVLAAAANWIYQELAAMFPESSGGIADYAAEAWKSRAPVVGPIAGIGYWFPWTTALAIYASIVGSLVQAQWFPDQDWSYSFGPATVDFPIAVGLVVIVLLFGAAMAGLHAAMWVVYVTGGMLLVPLTVFVVGPFVSGDWSAAGLHWNLHGAAGLREALVWLYIMAWTSFAVEVCLTFAPEYKDTVRDTSRALRAGVLFCLGVFLLMPLSLSGYLGEAKISAEPVTFYVGAFQRLIGGGADLMVVFLIGSLLLIMITGLADGSRVLYHMGVRGTTIRQAGVLTRRGVPARALWVALVLNVLAITVLQTPLAIIVTGNLGYILTHVLALSGFALLRRDRPDAARPIRLPAVFVPIAWLLAALLLLVLVVGATGFEISGYGGYRELAVALGVMAAGVGLWLYRTKVQDRRTPTPSDRACSGAECAPKGARGTARPATTAQQPNDSAAGFREGAGRGRISAEPGAASTPPAST
ncbi:APC family permease [Streptomyces sp. LHD-70]|uniref:APC family permease n=1 Tax=Streptomyces sp. LHD-70 TaxID=3072140 RepID=UPI00280C778E|nr:APC family permease [Streptomyces sp. LHD-70]MDQ8702587.1 APC family permease [Streptomyces sp. LHD-70]